MGVSNLPRFVNSRPLNHESDALTTTPYMYVMIILLDLMNALRYIVNMTLLLVHLLLISEILFKNFYLNITIGTWLY